MSGMHDRLLGDAREALVRPLRRLTGRNDLDEVFAAWFLGSPEIGPTIEGPFQQALTTGRRTARGVAILGFAAAAQGFEFKHRAELSDSLSWIAGRPETIAGSPASFTTDAIALLGIALGTHQIGDAAITKAVAGWMARFLPGSCSRPSLGDWERCLFAASRRLVNAAVTVPLPNEESVADVRVALRSRNLLPPVQRGVANADKGATLSLMLDPADKLCPAQIVLRVAAYDHIRQSVKTANRGPKFILPSEPVDSEAAAISAASEAHMSGAVRNKVFISYAWETPAHQENVVSLANALRDNGIESRIDVFIPGMPPEGLPAWMLLQIRWADYVLCVCTEKYRKRCEGEEEPGKGKGVKWEGGIITRTLYQQEFQNNKFIPVVFDKNDIANIPTILSGATYYDFSRPDAFENLIRHLTGQPAYIPNPIGKVPVLPPRDVKPFKPGS